MPKKAIAGRPAVWEDRVSKAIIALGTLASTALVLSAVAALSVAAWQQDLPHLSRLARLAIAVARHGIGW
jgi:hypothetical protein